MYAAYLQSTWKKKIDLFDIRNIKYQNIKISDYRSLVLSLQTYVCLFHKS